MGRPARSCRDDGGTPDPVSGIMTAAEKYGIAQGVSNGCGDDAGPSEMPGSVLDALIARFIQAIEQATNTPAKTITLEEAKAMGKK